MTVILLASIPIYAFSNSFSGFTAVPGENEIFLYWQVPSEAGILGFYVWRSAGNTTDFKKLPTGGSASEQFIPANGSKFYGYIDFQVTPDVVYYYKVQDVPDDGSEGEYSEVKSASIAEEGATDTPTPTSTPTQTPTPTLTPYPKPDLQIQDMSLVPKNPGLKKATEITVTIVNASQVDISESFFVDMYEDHKPLGCDDFGWAYAFIPRLLAGEKYTTHFTHQGFTDSDSHSFYAQVDSGCTINEELESNNIVGPVYVSGNDFRVYLPVLMKVTSR
jgi:hypothetical protein